MKKSLKFFMMFALALLLMIPITACSQKEELKTLRVAEVTHSIFYAPQYVALSEGFFEEEGLKIDLKTTWGGDKTMTALLSGGADIALVGSETSIYVYSQGTNDPVINFAHVKLTFKQVYNTLIAPSQR
ncbi:NitT/TauT family transport system substrate-binding protein [Anoxybacillus vitaminiphilus]|uniref:NitT/TauT family transport system substrate-binding protein n=1 Tax=Paranoxybacillus vitaminiphilus TaxID=581036 RepID=A0A327YKY2_9BACL|nr:NitT/TauT family transport system substrate-binding protein [Anoxybacillus vitaminiphilus]